MVKISRAIIWGILAFILTYLICSMAAEYKNNMNGLYDAIETKYEKINDLYLEGI